MTGKRILRTDKEWITLLSSRHVNESMGAFSKRIAVAYTQIYGVLKRYPEVRKLPAYATGAVEKKEPKAAKVRGIRVLKAKVPKLPPPEGTKRRGRPPGTKNKPKGAKAAKVDKPTPADPMRSNTRPIASKSAEEIFYQDLSIALKSGRRLRIELQLMPEGA